MDQRLLDQNVRVKNMNNRILKLFVQIALVCALVGFHTLAPTTGVTRTTVYECEGNACSVIALTWNQDRQQFKVENSSDQQVKVTVTTFAGTSAVTVLAHKTEYLEVKTFNGPYTANYE
jgi:hypothetical protein